MKHMVTKKVIALVLIFTVEPRMALETFAGSVERKKDCRNNETCLVEYENERERWLNCLKDAGVSEKKIKVLSRKVESIGIRNLKKTEILIFNSLRKDCHKEFSRALSDLQRPSSNPGRLPPLIDRLEKMPGNSDHEDY